MVRSSTAPISSGARGDSSLACACLSAKNSSRRAVTPVVTCLAQSSLAWVLDDAVCVPRTLIFPSCLSYAAEASAFAFCNKAGGCRHEQREVLLSEELLA